MQLKSLRLLSYRSWKIDDRKYSAVAKERYRKLEVYHQLRAEGCKEETALVAIGLSRARFYRYKQAYKRRSVSHAGQSN